MDSVTIVVIFCSIIVVFLLGLINGMNYVEKQVWRVIQSYNYYSDEDRVTVGSFRNELLRIVR